METKEQRLTKLRTIGAGGAQCSDCLSFGVIPMDTCEQCLTYAPSFTAAVDYMMRTMNHKQPPILLAPTPEEEARRKQYFDKLIGDAKPSYDDLDALLTEKYDEIRDLVAVVREIYAIAGEDARVARLCNGVLESARFADIRTSA